MQRSSDLCSGSASLLPEPTELEVDVVLMYRYYILTIKYEMYM